jgi:hypothetical protein
VMIRGYSCGLTAYQATTPARTHKKIRIPCCTRGIHGAAAGVRSNIVSIRSAGPREQGV